MIKGVITLYPRYGEETYIESKSKIQYRNIPCRIDGCDEDIYINIREDIYEDEKNDHRIKKSFYSNNFSNKQKFIVTGSLKNSSSFNRNSSLSDIYIKVDNIQECSNDINLNWFSYEAHNTKKAESSELGTIYKIVSNKAILNEQEKINKYATYIDLITPSDNNYQHKDIIIGNGQLIYNDNNFALLDRYSVHDSSSREISDIILAMKNENISNDSISNTTDNTTYEVDVNIVAESVESLVDNNPDIITEEEISKMVLNADLEQIIDSDSIDKSDSLTNILTKIKKLFKNNSEAA